jgi:hypothetical protein
MVPNLETIITGDFKGWVRLDQTFQGIIGRNRESLQSTITGKLRES